MEGAGLGRVHLVLHDDMGAERLEVLPGEPGQPGRPQPRMNVRKLGRTDRVSDAASEPHQVVDLNREWGHVPHRAPQLRLNSGDFLAGKRV